MRAVDDLRLVLRGLWFRRGVSIAVLLLSALVVGGAVTGPLFLRAAGESVLHDTLATSDPIGRQVRDSHGSTAGYDGLAQLRQDEASVRAQAPVLVGVLRPPVEGEQARSLVGVEGVTPDPSTLFYRQDVCAHVAVGRGTCPTEAGTVAVSEGAAATQHWQVGTSLLVNGVALRVVGTYAPLDPSGDYWSGHPPLVSVTGGDGLDALLTPLATFATQPRDLVTEVSVDRTLDVARSRLAQVPALESDLSRYALGAADRFQSQSAISAVLQRATEVSGALTLPVVVVEAQLLLLCWMVLFLVTANAAEARGSEVALAKLRGVPVASTVAFGLLDTLLLVLLAVPLGLLLAVLGVRALAATQLAPDTPVAVPASALLAAAGAGAGAAVAAVLSASRTLRRPVVEQWRRAARRPPGRSPLVDAVVVAAAAAGIVLLVRAGATTRGRSTTLALVAPGVLVLAVAMVGSRALPALCRARFARTRRSGRIPAFLAVRQVARRPGTLRLALVLAVAFGLVTFAVDAESVSRGNQHDRAWTTVGAAEVLTVSVPPGEDLGRLVEAADPTGRQAAAVTLHVAYEGSTPTQVMAVQPERFARVAFWRSDFGPAPLADLARRLSLPLAPPVTLTGDRIEVTLDVGALSTSAPLLLSADVAATGYGIDPVTLGALHPGRVVLTGPITCAQLICRLDALRLSRQPGELFPFSASVELTGVRVERDGVWTAVDAGLRTPGAWSAAGRPRVGLQPGDAGLAVQADAGPTDEPAFRPHDRPDAVPALVTAASTTGTSVGGLDGQPLPLETIARTAALPGTTDSGVIVDRDLALRVAGGAEGQASQTVWLSEPGRHAVPAALRARGVTVLSTASAPELTAVLTRQGPALAILLFLAGAALGALLAAGGTALNLYLSGRRRTYELAAMAAVGVRRRALLGSLCLEQGVLVAFGVGVGVLAGLLGAVLALPAVPEFADAPTAPPLLYGTHVAPVLAVALGAVAVLAVVAVASARNLLRTARPAQLREAPA